MIQIISGTYGYRNASGILETKRPGDAPLTLTAKEEARLVKRGVAEYVGGASAAEPIPAETDPDSGSPNGTGSTTVEPEYNVDMKLEELKEIAELYGVDASTLRSKQAVVDAIDAKLAGGTQDNDEGGAPDLTPAAPQL